MDRRSRRGGTLVWAGVILGAAGCLRLAPNVASPSALERQLLGAYEEIDADLVLASSVRGGAGAPEEEGARADAVRARALMRFHQDDLAELKAAGCIAETLAGAIVARPCPADRRLARVLEDENRARRDVLAYAALRVARARGRPPSAADREEVRAAFTRLIALGRKKGEWYEASPGVFRAAD